MGWTPSTTIPTDTISTDEIAAYSAAALTLKGRQADGVGCVGVITDTENTFTQGKLLSIRNNTAEKAYVDYAGRIFSTSDGDGTTPALVFGSANVNGFYHASNTIKAVANGTTIGTFSNTNFQINGTLRQQTATVPLKLEGQDASDGSAKAIQLGNANALTTAGDRLLSIFSDSFSTERAYVNYLGGALFSSAIVVNEDGNDVDTRIEGNGDTSLLYVDAGADSVGVGIAAPLAKLHVDQSVSDAAIPVLTVDQADVSEEFIKFIGTSAGDNTQSLVDAADLTTPGSIVGWLRIYVQDDAGAGDIADGVYFVPFYSTPTA